MTTEDQNLVNLALHGYAPRGLNFKCIDVDSGEFEILPLVRLNYEQDYATIGNHEFYFDELPLLWLHPIECLTKPITVEGYNDWKEFIPMFELAKIATRLTNCAVDAHSFNVVDDRDVEIEGSFEVSFTSRCIDRCLNFMPNHGFVLHTYDPQFNIDTCLNQFEMIDFMNMCHLDWRGLIPKGLAVAITEI